MDGELGQQLEFNNEVKLCLPRRVKYIEEGGKSYLLLKRGEKEGKLSFAQDIWFATDNGCKSFTILANCRQAPALLQDVHVHCSSTSSVSLHPP